MAWRPAIPGDPRPARLCHGRSRPAHRGFRDRLEKEACMTSRVIPVAPFVLTVFGATGDLACRKLLPALFRRDFDGQLPEAANILGAARRPMSRDELVALARDAIVEHIPASQTSGPELDRFLARLLFFAVDAD